MDNRIKEFIFNKLYKKLRNVEIISHNDSIWFIDVEEKYWYFEFEKSGRLWWRYYFFDTFFKPFSLLQTDYEKILSSWVEEVLNHKVSTTSNNRCNWSKWVEEVLNHKVSTTQTAEDIKFIAVEEVLNHKVSTTQLDFGHGNLKVEEVLNHKVNITHGLREISYLAVEEVLNHKVTTTEQRCYLKPQEVEEVLNQ